MKRLFLIFLGFPSITFAQLCFDFESGMPADWKQSRVSAWITSGTDPLCGSYSLWHCLDDSIGGEDRISFAYDSLMLTDSATTTWQFALRHAYAPSSSNKWAVFLLSSQDEEQMRPGGKTEAVVLGVNFNGSDDLLKLWRTREGEAVVIAETDLDWQEEIGTGAVLLRIRREQGGKWTIELGRGSGTACSENTFWEAVGEGEDSASISPGYFGIYYRFSSRQDRKLWFDGLCIRGVFIPDTVPPCIKGFRLLDEHTIRVWFSENLAMPDALSGQRYVILPGERAADSVWPVDDNTLDLVYRNPFPMGSPQTLRIRDIADLKGNLSGTLEVEFTWYRAVPGDVVFNEIMYDPVPEIALPGYEYIELFNRSGFPLEMGGWTLHAGEKAMALPDFSFPPGDPLLLCYGGTGELYGEALHALDVLPSRTFLANEGTALALLDKDSVLIDWMEYSPLMHAGEYFAEGGWSLERIDPDRTCHGDDNWSTSRGVKGGTPGMENAVRGINPDRTSPDILSVFVQDPHNIIVEFSEVMDRQSVMRENAWHTGGGMGGPDSISLQSPRNRVLTLWYRQGLVPGREYYLEARGEIEDCSGNGLPQGMKTRFAMPVPPVGPDIFLSEILFNPRPWCPDFIEVFNGGNQTFDLADLRLANRDPESGGIVSADRVITGHRLFYPGDYLVLTSDPEELRSFYTVYDPACLVKVPSMPQMGDVEGSVLVLDAYLEVMDEMNYDRGMHHPLLASDEGVSLERISFDIGAENRFNWHSASSTEGWGTPGRENSQSGEAIAESEGFEVGPEVFTPDMDGVDDVLLIRYRFGSPGLRARILVVDPRGRLVRVIAPGELLGTEGFYTWDGTDREGRRARTGLYLVLAEVNGPAKETRRYRKTCVLATGR
jgi:hypothetical protein